MGSTKTLSLQKMGGQTILVDQPSIDISLTLPEATPSICSSLNIQSVESTRISRILQNLQSFYDSLRMKQNNQFVWDQTQEVTDTDVVNYIDSISTNALPKYRFMHGCLRESNMPDVVKLKEQQERTEESKERLESIQKPEEHVSYYEGWFPLFRPMSEGALFGIFTTAVFLFLVSTALFLRLGGVDFQLILPFGGGTGFFEINTKYLYIGIGAAIVIGILTGILLSREKKN